MPESSVQSESANSTALVKNSALPPPTSYSTILVLRLVSCRVTDSGTEEIQYRIDRAKSEASLGLME